MNGAYRTIAGRKGGTQMMENTYFLTSTRGGIGLPAALLKLLGLHAGEPVRLTTRERQIIITPLNEPTSVELMADTTESFTVDVLAAAFPNSELFRLSQTVLQETPAAYDVGEFSEAAREAEPIERLQPLHRDFLEPGKRRARLSPSTMQAMLAQFSKFMLRI